MSKIQHASGVITLADGRQSYFSVGADGQSQWGAPSEQLGLTVDALEAMQDALRKGDYLSDEDEVDDSEHQAAIDLSIANHEIETMRGEA